MGGVPPDAMEYDKVLPVGSFELLGVSRAIIHPNRQVGGREVVFHREVERCRRNNWRGRADYFRGREMGSRRCNWFWEAFFDWRRRGGNGRRRAGRRSRGCFDRHRVPGMRKWRRGSGQLFLDTERNEPESKNKKSD